MIILGSFILGVILGGFVMYFWGYIACGLNMRKYGTDGFAGTVYDGNGQGS